jgi:hypothetical protein
MSLLVSADDLGARRAVARGALAPLAEGLRRELQPVIDGHPDVPLEKARLTRAGGRCDRDGTLLSYDPFDARHRCAACGHEAAGPEHDRFRLYWHQLWLAERAVHGALLGVVLDDSACVGLAADLLDRYAAQYLGYPNRDNVLGPSRPFFSTYLESIWLLQLVLALDLLETGSPSDATRALGGRVRDRLVAPSAALVASFDEGMSNRQVWNNAALLAAGRLLGDAAMVGRATTGPSGLHEHLGEALLADGSWYEGENYHLFAHRGLWYGVQLAERGGHELPAALRGRFDEGFAAPFRTILPDLTYPSRRDSQYAVSVRQPRFAESCELGLARGDDERLLGMLARLYDPSVPRAETGRASSSADVERNLPATGLTRADLSWRSLLLARERLPALVPVPLKSDLLPAQGFAILRREEGRVYAALDYGHAGGGHGHPDRLNLVLMDGSTRWFDDPGTGSYVDRSLHWYRSTLAHHAPLVDGRSQPRVHGTLVAYDEGPRGGWVCADAELAPDLQVRRSLVVLDDYLVDLMQWEGEGEHDVALPMHGVDLVDERGEALSRAAAPISGGGGLEDGFEFLQDTARIADSTAPFLHAIGSGPQSERAATTLRGWIRGGKGTSWWSAHAPDVPGRDGLVPMLLASHRGSHGSLLSVWGWRDTIAGVELEGDEVRVLRRDGSRDVHVVVSGGWRVDRTAGGVRESIVLGGFAPPSSPAAQSGSSRYAALREGAMGSLPARVTLGERHYRRSEESWGEAGRPAANVELAVTAVTGASVLHVALTVEPSHRLFVAPETRNEMDNEPAGINGDGAQLYVECGGRSGGWLLVPRRGASAVDVQPIAGWSNGLTAEATWRATDGGYRLEVAVPLPADAASLALDLLVNETGPGRERRRGQLLLSGADGEFIYLRGDRHDRRRLLRFTLPDV